MNKFYKIKFDPNKSYTIKLCSLEKKYNYYCKNYSRLCNENYKLKQEIEILKDKIRELIEKELPDDDLMEACSIVDVNGIAIREELEKIIRGE